MAPAGSGVILQRVGENPLRQQFVHLRNMAKCRMCAVQGAMKLTEGCVSAPSSLKCGKYSMVKERREAEAIVCVILNTFMENVNTAVRVHAQAAIELEETS